MNITFVIIYFLCLTGIAMGIRVHKYNLIFPLRDKIPLLLMEDKPNKQLGLKRFHILVRLLFEHRIRYTSRTTCIGP